MFWRRFQEHFNNPHIWQQMQTKFAVWGTSRCCLNIRECGSTLYVEMVWVVMYSLYMGIEAKCRNRLATVKTSLYRAKHTTDVAWTSERWRQNMATALLRTHWKIFRFSVTWQLKRRCQNMAAVFVRMSRALYSISTYNNTHASNFIHIIMWFARMSCFWRVFSARFKRWLCWTS